MNLPFQLFYALDFKYFRNDKKYYAAQVCY